MFPEPFEDSRRLTGGNLYFDGTGAALETARGLVFDESTLAAWKRNIGTARAALGWPEEKIVIRRHRTGASLAFKGLRDDQPDHAAPPCCRRSAAIRCSGGIADSCFSRAIPGVFFSGVLPG